MVADSPAPVTDREATIRFHDFRSHRPCAYCNLPIHWMFTRYGTRLPFDAELLPRHLDPDNSGWLPGTWKIQGRDRMAMAPMHHYGRRKMARVSHVAVLHRCPNYELACQLGIVPAKVEVVA